MSDDDVQSFDIDGDGDIDMEVGVAGEHTFVHLMPETGNESVGVFDESGVLVGYAEDGDADGQFTDGEWVVPDQPAAIDDPYEPRPADIAEATPDQYEPAPADVEQVAPDNAVPGDPPMPADIDAVPGPDAVDHGVWVEPAPANPLADGVVSDGSGDPDERSEQEVAEDASHWFQQGTDFTCGPASASALLADYFDIEVADESELYAMAVQHDLITENGMTIDDLSTLISLYNVDNDVVVMNLEQLDGRLDAGYGVLLFVDGNEYWHDGALSDGGVNFGDANDAPHFIRVIDIDEENDVAIVSDSGSPDGEGLRIPLDDLDRAWGESGHLAVTTLVADDDASPAAATSLTVPPAFPDAAQPGFEGDELAGADIGDLTDAHRPGWIILPIVASTALAARLFVRGRTG